MGKGSSSAAVGKPTPTEQPPLPEMPGEEYYSRAQGNAQAFNRGHQGQITQSPLALAYGSRPIDWTKASMLAQRMPGLQDMLAKSMGGQFANGPVRQAPAPQPEVIEKVVYREPNWQATSDYEIAMNDGIDPYPWRTDMARARGRG